MNATKNLTAACSALALTLATCSGAIASSGVTNKVFVSGPLILIFLGFCALVVVIQCVPAIIMLIGMIKGATSKKTVGAASNKYH